MHTCMHEHKTTLCQLIPNHDVITIIMLVMFIYPVSPQNRAATYFYGGNNESGDLNCITATSYRGAKGVVKPRRPITKSGSLKNRYAAGIANSLFSIL